MARAGLVAKKVAVRVKGKTIMRTMWVRATPKKLGMQGLHNEKVNKDAAHLLRIGMKIMGAGTGIAAGSHIGKGGVAHVVGGGAVGLTAGHLLGRHLADSKMSADHKAQFGLAAAAVGVAAAAHGIYRGTRQQMALSKEPR